MIATLLALLPHTTTLYAVTGDTGLVAPRIKQVDGVWIAEILQGERLIAAARIWLTMVDDREAARIIDRPTVRHDPMAVALDLLARRLSTEPDALRGAPLSEGILTS